MDQHVKPEKAQEEADDTGLDVVPGSPSLSPPRHRPGHHSAFHRHDEHHHHDDFHNFHHSETHRPGKTHHTHDGAHQLLNRVRPHHLTPSPGISPSLDGAHTENEHEHGQRIFHHRVPHSHAGSSPGEIRHHHRVHHHEDLPQHGETPKSTEGTYYGDTHHVPNKYHHVKGFRHGERFYRSGHYHGQDHRRDHRDNSQLLSSSYPSSSGAIPSSSSFQDNTQQTERPDQATDSHYSSVHLQNFQVSNKVHPLATSSPEAESWHREEQPPNHKTTHTRRTHRRQHHEDVSQFLFKNLSHFTQWLRKRLLSLIKSLVFETFIFLTISLNTIMMVVQTFAEVEVRGEWYFMAMDTLFLSIYVVEAIIKIMALGFTYFSDFWNKLDFFIVVMSMLDFTLSQVDHSFPRSISNQSIFRVLKVLKSLRALRAIRVLRSFSALSNLQEVTGTLGRSLPSITAILILMFTCLFLFSVVLRALFRHSDPKRFQNIFTTIFTLFIMLTLDDWSLIYLDSRAQGAWYIVPILMIYIIIQYFIFLNLVIAVLVDNFQMALLRGLEKEKLERAARTQVKLLGDSVTELGKAEMEQVSQEAMHKQLIEKKFGNMTEKQKELLFYFLQLVAGVEHLQLKFRSQACVIDEIVDTAFEVGEEDFRK